MIGLRPGGTAVQPGYQAAHRHAAARGPLRPDAEKVTQYKAACENHQQQSGEFVPFVATTDGVLGGGAQKVLSQLVERLCTKWEHKSKGEVMAWVRARIGVAIVRAASACIRGH